MSILLESERLDGSKGLVFYCPGCKMYHSVVIAPGNYDNGASWTWNENMEKPTFNPSVMVRLGLNQEGIDRVCHLFVRNGMIEFLGDSTHELKGQNVPMESVD